MYMRWIGPVRAQTAALMAGLQSDGRFRPGAIEAVHFFLTTWGIGGPRSVPTMGPGGRDSRRHRIDAAHLAIDVVIDGLRITD